MQRITFQVIDHGMLCGHSAPHCQQHSGHSGQAAFRLRLRGEGAWSRHHWRCYKRSAPLLVRSRQATSGRAHVSQGRHRCAA
jgi:hypothetical protein